MSVTWADSPATSSPLDAANLDHLLQDDGSVTATAPTPVSVTLGGTSKAVTRWIATDGKTYEMFITTSGELTIYNATDAVVVAAFGPTGAILVGGSAVPTVGAHNAATGLTLSAGAGAPSALATNEIYFQLS